MTRKCGTVVTKFNAEHMRTSHNTKKTNHRVHNKMDNDHHCFSQTADKQIIKTK